MTINYLALKSELLTDPAVLGLTAPFNAGADNAVAVRLNAVIAGNKINTGVITAQQFGGLITQSEFGALTVAQQNWLNFIMITQQIDLNNAVIKGGLLALFGAGSASRTNVIAAQQRDGSRAETLFGVGTVLTDVDIAQARKS